MHQNYHFIVMLSQMLVHVSTHHRHQQGAHTILTSYLSVACEDRVSSHCMHCLGCDRKPVHLNVLQWPQYIRPC
jgi:hypothetical protein